MVTSEISIPLTVYTPLIFSVSSDQTWRDRALSSTDAQIDFICTEGAGAGVDNGGGGGGMKWEYPPLAS